MPPLYGKPSTWCQKIKNNCWLFSNERYYYFFPIIKFNHLYVLAFLISSTLPLFLLYTQLPWKWTINLFPERIPHAKQAWQPQDGGCCAVNKKFSWASLPLKGTFFLQPWSCEKCHCQKGPKLFFSHKDVRRRELEFPNMLICVSLAPSSTTLCSSC